MATPKIAYLREVTASTALSAAATVNMRRETGIRPAILKTLCDPE